MFVRIHPNHSPPSARLIHNVRMKKINQGETMKARLANLLVVGAIYGSFAEPGGTYTLTGEEKGIAEIVKVDMAKFPELYKGETLKSYLSKFKSENKIGRKKYKPGDQLIFPHTMASLKSGGKVDSSEGKLARAKISSKLNFNRFRDGTKVVGDSYKFYSHIPEKYDGWMVSTVKETTTEPTKFEIKEAGIVSIVVFQSVLKKYNSEGWEKVDELKFNEEWKVWILEKYLEVGEYTFDEPKLVFLLKE
jgi:hypothetical protein